ncbi:putative transmembrane protein, partial [Toxoplasma gondii p89]
YIYIYTCICVHVDVCVFFRGLNGVLVFLTCVFEVCFRALVGRYASSVLFLKFDDLCRASCVEAKFESQDPREPQEYEAPPDGDCSAFLRACFSCSSGNSR